MKNLFRTTTVIFLGSAIAISLVGCGGSKKKANPVSTNIETSDQDKETFTSWKSNSKIRIAMDSQDYDEAENLALEQIRENPRDARAHFFLGKVFLLKNLPEKAEKSLETAIELEPQNRNFGRTLSDARIALADRAFNNGLPGESVNLLKKAMIKNYKSGQINEKLSRSYIATVANLTKEGNFAEAESLLNEAIGILPDQPEIRAKYADILVDSGRLMEAERILKKLVETNPNFEPGMLSYAKLLMRMGEISASEKMVNSILEIAPGNQNAIALRSQLNQNIPIISSPELNVSMDSDSIKEQLSSLEKSGNYDQQMVLLKKFVSLNPDQAWPKLELSRLTLNQGDIGQAKALVEEFLALEPNSISGLMLKARVLHQGGELNEALNLLMELENLHGDKLEVLNQLGQVYAKMGKFDQAKHVWQKVLDTDPNHSETLFSFGQLEMELGNNKEAQSYFENAIHKEPFNPKFRYFAGSNLMQSGLKSEALSLWESGKMYLNPEDPYGKRILLTLGETNPGSLSDSPPSLSGFDNKVPSATNEELPLVPLSVIEEAPTSSTYDNALQYARGGFFNEAIQGFHEVLRSDPNNFNAIMNLGKVLTATGKNSDACAYYLKAMKIDPNNIHAQRALANSYSEQGLHNFAAEITDQVRRIAPEQLQGFPRYKENHGILRNNPRAFRPLARSFVEAGLTQEALAVVQTGRAEMPESSELFLLEGEIFKSLNQFEQSLVSFKKAQEKDPQNPEPLVRIGDLYKLAGQPSQAIIEYQKALKAGFIDADTMFEIVERFNELGREADARRVLGRLKGMNLNQNQIAKLEQHLGTTIQIESGEN
jgi:tetratricopeptide (TPR) repeat protein